MAMVVIATFSTVDEAQLLASRLRSAGIAAEVPDENTLATYALAIGGAKVAVPEGDVQDAIAIMKAEPGAADSPPSEPPSAE